MDEMPRFAWDQDTSLGSGLNEIGCICEGVETGMNNMRALFAHGLDPGIFTADVRLGGIDGLLVLSGLQLLGIVDANIREDLTELIVRIHRAQPVLTEDHQQQVQDAVQRFAESGFFGMADEVGRDN